MSGGCAPPTDELCREPSGEPRRRPIAFPQEPPPGIVPRVERVILSPAQGLDFRQPEQRCRVVMGEFRAARGRYSLLCKGEPLPYSTGLGESTSADAVTFDPPLCVVRDADHVRCVDLLQGLRRPTQRDKCTREVE